MDRKKLKDTLTEIAGLYPAEIRGDQYADINRLVFNIGLVLDHTNGKGRVCDLGGGLGMFSVGCAAMGLSTVLVDDFSDPVSAKVGESIFQIHRKFGVEIVSADLIASRLNFAPASFDSITTFDSIEHWHNSPKKLFADVRLFLKEGGQFILCGPNCVNLRKRITVPFGRGKWSSLGDWYEFERFRGHVREPDVGDLKYIAADMKLKNVRIIGRNWLAYISKSKAIRVAGAIFDPLLRPFPSLCADIYMVGYK